MNKLVCAALFAGSISLVACGGDDASDPDPAPVAVKDDSHTVEQPAPNPVSPAPSSTGIVHEDSPPAKADPPAAPSEEGIKTSYNGVVLTWSTTDACDTIVGERKSGLVPYTQIFSVSGTTVYTDASQLNAPGADATQFTYRVRCERDGVFSVYSNEMSSYGAPPPAQAAQ